MSRGSCGCTAKQNRQRSIYLKAHGQELALASLGNRVRGPVSQAGWEERGQRAGRINSLLSWCQGQDPAGFGQEYKEASML